MTPFHLAFPITDIEKTQHFYHVILGCKQGRSAPKWIDFNFFGHQISAHLIAVNDQPATNPVDGDNVPVRHFGAILDWNTWEKLAERIEQHNYGFRITPRIRFQGKAGEQGTFFIDDPSGNSLEFKTFKNFNDIFNT